MNKTLQIALTLTFLFITTILVMTSSYTNGKEIGFKEGVAYQKCIDEDLNIPASKENYEKYYLPQEQNILTYIFPTTINVPLLKNGLIFKIPKYIYKDNFIIQFNNSKITYTKYNLKYLSEDSENVLLQFSNERKFTSFNIYYGEKNSQIYNEFNSKYFKYKKQIFPTTTINSTELINIAEINSNGEPLFYISNEQISEVWILLKDNKGHLKIKVSDLEHLTTNYIHISDFNSSESHWIIQDKPVFVSHTAIKIP